ncbi:zona pellucida sperm-binding protein 3-like [Arapaima gigas]
MAKVQGLVVNLLLVLLLLESFCLLYHGFSFQGVGAEPYDEQPLQHGYTATHFRRNIIGEGIEDSASSTVKVRCHTSTMEIVIQPDLYGVGTNIDVSDLRLGANPHPKTSCKPTVSENGEYVIVVSLTDCGTKRLITEDSLIYVNLLVYSPSVSLRDIIRTKEAAIPIECYYPRNFHVSSDALKPDSVAQPSEDPLEFSLMLMNSDWQSKRESNQYVLGDYINIEAAVKLRQATPLHLFVDNCVASPLPDKTASPRYSFIENNGCLFDALMTGSRSMFLQRTEENKLQLQLESFSFYRQHKNTLYITCLLVALPSAEYGESDRRACSFLDGGWKSADGNDYECFTCDQALWITHPLWSSVPVVDSLPKGFEEKSRRRSKASDAGNEGLREWAKKVTLGPVLISTPEDHTASRKRTEMETDEDVDKTSSSPTVSSNEEDAPLSI